MIFPDIALLGIDYRMEQCKDTDFFAIFARLCACSCEPSAKGMINNNLSIDIWNFLQSMILP